MSDLCISDTNSKILLTKIFVALDGRNRVIIAALGWLKMLENQSPLNLP